jgi:hypothetical protein
MTTLRLGALTDKRITHYILLGKYGPRLQRLEQEKIANRKSSQPKKVSLSKKDKLIEDLMKI